MTAKATAASKKSPAYSRTGLVSQYTPLVRAIAAKIKKSLSSNIDFDELVEYGLIGLLEAADRFDNNQDVAFSTFAYYRIRGAIYDGLRNMGWLSRNEYSKIKYEARANSYLAEEEIAISGNISQISPAEAAEKLTAIVNNLATIFITTMDGQDSLQISDQSQLPQEQEIINSETTALLRQALSSLNDQERQLIELYYYNDKSMQEIGDLMGLSKSWTSRLHARIIEKLHRILQRMEL